MDDVITVHGPLGYPADLPDIDDLLASVGWRRIEVQYSTPIDDGARVRLQRKTKPASMKAAYHDGNNNSSRIAKK